MFKLLRWLLAEPSTRGIELDAPETSDLHREMVLTKQFLWRLYNEWYTWLALQMTPGAGRVLELGAGGGFLKDLLPETITSDVAPSSQLDVVIDGRHLPFANASLRAIGMTNVLHHIPDVQLFFNEASRCVRPGGVIAMIEPWVTGWSRLVYGCLHHEVMDPHSSEWTFEAEGRMSDSNMALPWIIFERDRRRFEEEFPQWRIEITEPFMPLRYLLSGGVSMRTVVPVWSYKLWQALERRASTWITSAGMFAKIRLTRTDAQS